MALDPGWVEVGFSAVAGGVVTVLAAARFGWFGRDRTAVIEASLMRLESKIDRDIQLVSALIDKKLQDDRHHNINPMLQVRIIEPLDKLEERTGALEQDMAVMKDRLTIYNLLKGHLPEDKI